MVGALDYASGQVSWEIQVRNGGEGFAAFLDHLAQTWPDEHLALVMDNVSSHRSQTMRAWWAAQDGRIVPFWVPALRPEPQTDRAGLALAHAEAGMSSVLA